MFLSRALIDEKSTRTALEIILKISSYSKHKETVHIQLAQFFDFFCKLVHILSQYVEEHQKGKEIPVYDCGLVLDTITLAMQTSSILVFCFALY